MLDAPRPVGDETYRLLFDAHPQPMWVFDPDTLRFLSVNRAAVRQYGWSEEEFLERTIADIRPPEDVARMEAAAREATASGRMGPSGVWRHRRRDGSLLDVEIHAEPVTYRGRPARLVVAVDVTERMRVERQLQQAQRLEAIGQLAGGIAHDFNNILGAALGYGELALARASDRPDVAAELEPLVGSLHRARDLVRQILLFSQRQERSRVPTPLGPLVRETLTLVRAGLPPRVALDLRVADGAATVLADPTAIHQIVMNLATNAIRAMEGGPGTLTVELDAVVVDSVAARGHRDLRPGEFARITVRDTGAGMDHDTLQRMYEPFFTTRRQGEGTGLGLAVVHGIVRSHGGAVLAESEPGRGTVMQVLLPVRDAGDAAAAAPPPERTTAARAPLGGGQRILVVDDEPALLEVSRRLLERLGYAADTAASAEEALRRLAEAPGAYDLVITDYTMPGMNGVELAERVREVSAVPLVLTTGASGPLTAEGARRLGFAGLMLKPVSTATLAETVLLALAGRQAASETDSMKA